MFSLGGPSSTGYSIPSSARLYRTPPTQGNRTRVQEEQIYRTFIKEVAKNIFFNPAQFKMSLEEAATAYLKEIKDKWFRGNGRERAEKLIAKLTQAKTTAQLIPAFIEVINAGNEEKDSLKTFIFNSLNLNFCNKKLDHYNYTYTSQLMLLAAEMTEIKMLRDKSYLCFAGFYSVNSNFHRLPRELVREIVNKLNTI